MADKLKILIAEDEEALSNALKLKLTSEGYDVTVANNGEKAVKNLLVEDFDLMILDLVMPKENGFEVLEKIKKEKISLPIIALSNLSQKIDVDKAKELGIKEYFIKSNTPLKEVVEKVKQYI